MKLDLSWRKLTHFAMAIGRCGMTWPLRKPADGGQTRARHGDVDRQQEAGPPTRRAIVPPAFGAAAEQLKMSPAILSGQHVFFTGLTGSGPDGLMPDDPETQFRNAFDKIGVVLHEAGLTFQAVVEMTSYHVGLRGHFDLFNSIRLGYFGDPWPAWTAVEVAGLRREGALVEIRVIASTGRCADNSPDH